VAPATTLSLERLCLVFGPCCLLLFFLRAELVLVLPRVLALGVSVRLKVALQRLFSSLVCETCILLPCMQVIMRHGQLQHYT